MPVLLRSNAAAVNTPVGQPQMSGGGSAGAPLAPRRGGKVEQKARYAKDPAAELMPAAEFLGFEPDFAAILEDFEGSPFDPARRRVLGKLMGVFAMDYQGARSEERRFLRRLLLSGNAKEGYAANRALHLLGLPNVIRRTLALGVATSRFKGGPRMGHLGAVQARLAANTFQLLGPEGKELVWNLLTRAGCDDAGRQCAGSDRVIERALVLKALAARRHRLGPLRNDGPVALREVEQFAEAIRGVKSATLAVATTLYPGIPDKQAPRLTSLVGSERAAYLARGDIDPAFAWQEHKPRADKSAAAQIEDDEWALPDLDRSPIGERARLHWALAEARQRKLLEPLVQSALTDYLGGRELNPTRLAKKDQAIATLKKDGFDIVRPLAIDAIRQDAQGIYKFDAARAFGDLVGRYTGATYLRRLFSDQATAGADPLGQIETALALGMAVPVAAAELKLPIVRPFLAQSWTELEGQAVVQLYDAQRSTTWPLFARALLASQLPQELGQRCRADAYFAPAALDLFIPPFGLSCKELGLEDRL